MPPSERASTKKEAFLRAARGGEPESVPVWIMRQAGRYLPGYRRAREQFSFLEIAKNPEVAAQVSIEPLHALDVDAVIVFSDILIVAEAMGLTLEINDDGPRLGNVVREAKEVEKLKNFDPAREMKFVGDTIRAIVNVVGPDVPVIGFAAAPWTLACYMVEGKTRGELSTIKRMMYSEPALLHALLERISKVTSQYLKMQLEAGAATVQIFDTWAGELSAHDYEVFELPATQQMISDIHAGDAPVILYAKNGAHLLPALARTGANVLSVDWRTDLADARKKLGIQIALQGNIDPAMLLSSEENIRFAVREAISKLGGVGHILNLGHGILPTTPVENAQTFVRAAHEFSTAKPTLAAQLSALNECRNIGSSMMQMSGRIPDLEVSEEFLARYNRPGPRYTSYPTAPVWNENFRHSDLEHFFAAADRAKTPVSLYMHLPFCESLCLFCACNVVIQKDKSAATPYLQSLKTEIANVSHAVSNSREVVQFHWGGGTPTYLSPAQLEDLFGFTRERFSFAVDAEIRIEVDPRVTSNEHLQVLRKAGFNRLSMGIQDFTPLVQQTIHRVQPFEMTRELIVSARALGFESINVDLIYGLPYQTAASFSETAEKILELAPDRIAMFSYAHVPWLRKQQGAFQGHLPEGMEKFQIFKAGIRAFTEAGYLYIGMDHFAKPSDELAVAQRERTLHRNFQGYTTKAGADLYGMGVSAISSIGAAYAQNHRAIAEYQSAIDAHGTATMRGYALSQDDLLRREVITRLLCHALLLKPEIEREFAVQFDDYFSNELEQLAAMQHDGLVELSPNEICVTPLGRIFIRNLAMPFDRYLREQAMDSRPLFSKTL